MDDIPLEYRVSYSHAGVGKIETQGLVIHKHNPYWSYARHLPSDWDYSKAIRRKSVPARLMDRLGKLEDGQELDLIPLRDDQRVSGEIFGENPLQYMFDLILAHAHEFPEREFYALWGGGHFELPGKGFAIYVNDEKDAQESLRSLDAIALAMRIPIKAFHRYGPVDYQKYITIDERLRSKVADIKGFRRLLGQINAQPHFFHELFLNG